MPGIGQIHLVGRLHSTGNKTGEPSAFPLYAKECLCDSVRARRKSVCKLIVFTSKERHRVGLATLDSTERAETITDSVQT